jgi:hypothetical protein
MRLFSAWVSLASGKSTLCCLLLNHNWVLSLCHVFCSSLVSGQCLGSHWPILPVAAPGPDSGLASQETPCGICVILISTVNLGLATVTRQGTKRAIAREDHQRSLEKRGDLWGTCGALWTPSSSLFCSLFSIFSVVC